MLLVAAAASRLRLLCYSRLLHEQSLLLKHVVVVGVGVVAVAVFVAVVAAVVAAVAVVVAVVEINQKQQTTH